MTDPFELASLDRLLAKGQAYFAQEIISWAMAVQLAVVAGAILLAYMVARMIRTWITRQQAKCSSARELCYDLSRLTHFSYVIGPAMALAFLWIIYRIAEHFHLQREGLFAIVMCLLALTLTRLITGQMQSRIWAKIIKIFIWFEFFLNVTHLNRPWLNLLSHIDLNLGNIHISLLILLRAVLLLLVLYWLSRNLLFLVHFWLREESGLRPASQILLYKLSVVFFFCASTVMVLQYMGLGLTVFALFSGALGLGLGFGLQKVFANLVSGFIILADKSIKPGDVIQLGNKYGWINFLGTRYTSIITRNGTEHLIPNENLVTNEVVNWSYSNNLIRLDIPVGVGYATDLAKARDLMLAIAANSDRVLREPAPICYLVGFGDNSINFDLRIWINDPQNGLGSIKHEILWGIWQQFREHGIELPFPQRDVHLKSMPEVRIRTEPEKG